MVYSGFRGTHVAQQHGLSSHPGAVYRFRSVASIFGAGHCGRGFENIVERDHSARLAAGGHDFFSHARIGVDGGRLLDSSFLIGCRGHHKDLCFGDTGPFAPVDFFSKASKISGFILVANSRSVCLANKSVGCLRLRLYDCYVEIV